MLTNINNTHTFRGNNNVSTINNANNDTSEGGRLSKKRPCIYVRLALLFLRVAAS